MEGGLFSMEVYYRVYGNDVTILTTTSNVVKILVMMHCVAGRTPCRRQITQHKNYSKIVSIKEDE